VNKVNVYLGQTCPQASIGPDALRLEQAARAVTRVLAVLGISEGLADTLGFSNAAVASSGAGELQAVQQAFDGFCNAVEQALRGEGAKVQDWVFRGALEGCSDSDAALDELVAARDKVCIC
jgi:hypothetical protein